MKHLNILCASASLLLTTSAMADQTSAELVIKGSILPGPACTVALGGSALNLGTIKRDMLNPDPSKPTQLPEKKVSTTVACAHPTRFAFVVREAGGPDPSSDMAFTMHADDGEGRAGKLFLLFDTQSTKIDGVQGYATGADRMSELDQASWGPSTPSRENLPITNGRYAVGFVSQADSVTAPGNIKDLGVTLLVRPQISPANDLDLTGNIGFSSDLGLEISYF